MHVSALQCPDAGLAEPPTAVLREPRSPPVRLAELRAQAVRPLEVVADELVELGDLLGDPV